MYIKKEIVTLMVNYLTNNIDGRDNRIAAIESVYNTLQSEHQEITGFSLVLLAFDIDRAFRYVQQHVPKLRGKEWLYRQYISGEITKDEYLASSESGKDEIQLKLF